MNNGRGGLRPPMIMTEYENERLTINNNIDKNTL